MIPFETLQSIAPSARALTVVENVVPDAGFADVWLAEDKKVPEPDVELIAIEVALPEPTTPTPEQGETEPAEAQFIPLRSGEMEDVITQPLLAPKTSDISTATAAVLKSENVSPKADRPSTPHYSNEISQVMPGTGQSQKVATETPSGGQLAAPVISSEIGQGKPQGSTPMAEIPMPIVQDPAQPKNAGQPRDVAIVNVEKIPSKLSKASPSIPLVQVRSQTTRFPNSDVQPQAVEKAVDVRQIVDAPVSPKLIQAPTPPPQTIQAAAMVSSVSAPMITIDPVAEQATLDGLEIPPTGGLNVASSTRLMTTHPMQVHAPHVAQQIASAVVQIKTGLTEISLNPRELGKVRMAMHVTESAISVSIMSERPETADLMRRNIELLAREFREIGYGSVSFSFDDQSDPSENESGTPFDHLPNAEHIQFEADPAVPHTTVAVRNGLDLKL